MFYGTSATVIPVFMLAMAVQLRAKRVFSSFVGEGRWGRKALPLIAWIFLVANGGGEVASLMTLYYNSDDHTSAVLVFISVLVSAVLVLLGAADLLYGQVSERSGPLASDTAPASFAAKAAEPTLSSEGAAPTPTDSAESPGQQSANGD